MKKQVLFYAAGRPERAKQLKTVMEETDGIGFYEIKANETGQLVGHLVGQSGYPALPKTESLIRSEILLLDGFSDEELTDFLRFLRGHFFVVALKAVVTEQNRHWRLAELAVLLEKEHQMMQEAKR